MLRSVITRILLAIFTTLSAATIVFFAMRIVPGGFVTALLGPNAASSPEVLAALEDKYGLTQPVYVQYVKWLGNVLQGDFGLSMRMQTPVADEIIRRSKLTIEFTLLATDRKSVV